jgi:hypothetical protein
MGVNGQRHVHCTGGWVGPRAGLDTEATGKILLPPSGIEHWSPGCPARSQTLYCLSYPVIRNEWNLWTQDCLSKAVLCSHAFGCRIRQHAKPPCRRSCRRLTARSYRPITVTCINNSLLCDREGWCSFRRAHGSNRCLLPANVKFSWFLIFSQPPHFKYLVAVNYHFSHVHDDSDVC